MRKSALKKTHFTALVCAGVLAAASVFVHPFGAVKANSTRPLLAGADVDAAVLRILEKSCRNCHSEQTEWPWYSYVAPMSWTIEKDVHDARGHLNLSHWKEYDTQTQRVLLTEIAAVVRNGKMPLPRYTLLHPGAKPSSAEFDLIYQWARTQRRQLTANATRGVTR
jgi:Haem-binding domain